MVKRNKKDKKTKRTNKTMKSSKHRHRNKGGMIVPGSIDDYAPKKRSVNRFSGPPMLAPYRGIESKNREAMRLLEGDSNHGHQSDLAISDSTLGKWMSKSDENVKLREKKAKKAKETKSKSTGKSSTLTKPKKTRKTKTRNRRSSSVWKSIVEFFI